jgi:hypothetical protein
MFWLSSFFSLLFNFFYVNFLQEVLQDILGAIISSSDKVGVDVHIIRYLQMALFDSRLHSSIYSETLIRDFSLLVIVVLPLFILGLKFWTAPIYSAYASKLNSVLSPLSLVAIFFGSHLDIKLMGIIVLMMNSYVFWYHVDPPEQFTEYKRFKRYRSNHRATNNIASESDSDEKINITKNKFKIDYGDLGSLGAQALSMGIPMPM